MLFFYRSALFLVVTFLVWGPFMLLMRADKNLKRPAARFLVWVPWGLGFLVLDILFNVTFGSLIWWERPRELVYTARLKRKVKERAVGADWQASILNMLDPGHV